jgi:N utilization substance protein B
VSEESPKTGDAPARGRRPSPSQARQRARRLALQALYGAIVNPASPLDLVAQFRSDHDFDGADEDFFTAAVTGVMRAAATLDADFAPLLDRGVEELDPVERAILRLGAWELRERIDVPYRVVIDQGVNLAKTFGASESHRYVNGVLDGLARRLRKPEVAARRG